jgi:uncharacterized protein YegJ (DUF2314 family)
MTGDFPLPISGGAGDAWPQVEQEPVNLITLLPPPSADAADASNPPLTLEEAVALLAETAGSELAIVDRPHSGDPGHPGAHDGAAWVALIAGPTQPAPMVIWLEPMRELPEETVKFLKAERVRWTLGLETMLEMDRAHEHLLSLIQLLGRAIPDSPAILNVNTEAWHEREELDSRLLPSGIQVSPSLLWLVHAVGDEPSDPSKSPHAWCYTVGRGTAGLPELEMHGVPVVDGRMAVGMLNAIGELLYESGLPPSGEPYEIGHDLWVRFLPWQQSAAAADTEWLGSTHRRKDHRGVELTGACVAVCALDSKLWPAEVAQRIKQGGAVLYKTQQATELDAESARRTLDSFAELFAMVPPRRREDTPKRLAAFVIKAGFAVPAKSHQSIPEDREHLWFETLRIEPTRVRGRLLNDPISIRHLNAGAEVWIDRTLVSGWQVITQRGQFGPDDHVQARKAIESIMRETADV